MYDYKRVFNWCTQAYVLSKEKQNASYIVIKTLYIAHHQKFGEMSRNFGILSPFWSLNTASGQVSNVFISSYLDVANCWNFGILKPLIHLFDIDEKMNADWHGWETTLIYISYINIKYIDIQHYYNTYFLLLKRMNDTERKQINCCLVLFFLNKNE